MPRDQPESGFRGAAEVKTLSQYQVFKALRYANLSEREPLDYYIRQLWTGLYLSRGAGERSGSWVKGAGN